MHIFLFFGAQVVDLVLLPLLSLLSLLLLLALVVVVLLLLRSKAMAELSQSREDYLDNEGDDDNDHEVRTVHGRG